MLFKHLIPQTFIETRAYQLNIEDRGNFSNTLGALDLKNIYNTKSTKQPPAIPICSATQGSGTNTSHDMLNIIVVNNISFQNYPEIFRSANQTFVEFDPTKKSIKMCSNSKLVLNFSNDATVDLLSLSNSSYSTSKHIHCIDLRLNHRRKKAYITNYKSFEFIRNKLRSANNVEIERYKKNIEEQIQFFYLSNQTLPLETLQVQSVCDYPQDQVIITTELDESQMEFVEENISIDSDGDFKESKKVFSPKQKGDNSCFVTSPKYQISNTDKISKYLADSGDLSHITENSHEHIKSQQNMYNNDEASITPQTKDKSHSKFYQLKKYATLGQNNNSSKEQKKRNSGLHQDLQKIPNQKINAPSGRLKSNAKNNYHKKTSQHCSSIGQLTFNDCHISGQKIESRYCTNMDGFTLSGTKQSFQESHVMNRNFDASLPKDECSQYSKFYVEQDPLDFESQQSASLKKSTLNHGNTLGFDSQQSIDIVSNEVRTYDYQNFPSESKFSRGNIQGTQKKLLGFDSQSSQRDAIDNNANTGNIIKWIVTVDNKIIESLSSSNQYLNSDGVILKKSTEKGSSSQHINSSKIFYDKTTESAINDEIAEEGVPFENIDDKNASIIQKVRNFKTNDNIQQMKGLTLSNLTSQLNQTATIMKKYNKSTSFEGKFTHLNSFEETYKKLSTMIYPDKTAMHQNKIPRGRSSFCEKNEKNVPSVKSILNSQDEMKKSKCESLEYSQTESRFFIVGSSADREKSNGTRMTAGFKEINLSSCSKDDGKRHYGLYNHIQGFQLDYIGNLDAHSRPHQFGRLHFPGTSQLFFEGNFLEGKIDGYGRTFWIDKQVLYEGNMENDSWNGYGIKYNENGGKLYEGSFLNNEYNGLGTLYRYYSNEMVKYKGVFHKGSMHGEGKLYDKNGGLLYIGGFENGKIKTTEGKFFDSTNGLLIYKGGFDNGKFNGKGKLYDLLDNKYFQYKGIFFNNFIIEGDEYATEVFLVEKSGGVKVEKRKKIFVGKFDKFLRRNGDGEHLVDDKLVSCVYINGCII